MTPGVKATLLMMGAAMRNSDLQGGDDPVVVETLLQQFNNFSLWPIVFTQGSFYVYDENEGYWVEIEEGDMKGVMQNLQGATYGQRGVYRANWSKVNSLYKSFTIRQRVREVHWFSEKARGIPFKNCFVEVLEGGEVEVREHSPDHRVRTNFPMDYNPQAQCPNFMKLLDDVFLHDKDKDEKIMRLQEYVGVSMAGEAPKYQKCLIATGEGSNGKSTVFDIIMSLFPKGTITSIPPQAWSEEYQRALLANSLVNYVPDMSDGKIFASSEVKPIITGDPVTARSPYKEPFAFRPMCSQLFVTNSLPSITDFSFGYRRRFDIIEFNRDFSAEKEIQRTKESIEKGCAGEKEGITVWALRGLQRLVSRGSYTVPASQVDSMNKWVSESDTVAEFMLTQTTKSELHTTQSKDVYGAYKTYCKENSIRPKAHPIFGKMIRQLGFKVKTVSGKAQVWVKLNNPPPVVLDPFKFKEKVVV